MRRSGVPATLATLLLLSSCRDASGPAPREELELPVLTASGPDTLFSTSGGAFTCTYTVRIRAEGPPRAFAYWAGGARTFVSTSTSQVRHDTLTAPDVWSLFAIDAITSGETQTAVVSSGLNSPHRATWVFSYRVGRKIGTVAYEALCLAPRPSRAAAARAHHDG